MTKKEAQAAAKKLLTLMGKGWKSRIWENMGWHYEVIAGNLTVIGHDYGWFTAGLADTAPCGSLGCWHSRASGKSPRSVAIKEVRSARKKVNECLASVEAAEKVLGLNQPTEVTKVLPTGWKRTTKIITVDGIPMLAALTYPASKKRKGK